MRLCECGCGVLVAGRFKRGHNFKFVGPDYVVDGNGCWVWQRSVNSLGYGQVWIKQTGEKKYAHRVFYDQHVGPIPNGLVLDHLCRNRACVNPEHLEPVTHAENLLRGVGSPAINARKTHCVRGHELFGENLYVDPRGRRQCRACRSEAKERFQAEHPERGAFYKREQRRRRREAWGNVQPLRGNSLGKVAGDSR